MSIQQDRKKSLTEGRFGRLTEVHCDFLQQCYIQRYCYRNTYGRLFREKPLSSIERWSKSTMNMVRDNYIENGGKFR